MARRSCGSGRRWSAAPSWPRRRSTPPVPRPRPARRALNGPGRLPGEAPPPAASPPPEPPLVLTGILASGTTRKALFAGMDTWLPEGGEAWRWRVVEIEPRRVKVRRGEEERVLDASDALRP